MATGTIQWKSVRDEFPEHWLYVLVSMSGAGEDKSPVWFGWSDGRNWYVDYRLLEDGRRVTHWAEFPMRVEP